MKPLSVAVALFGLAALVQPVMQMNIAAALLGGVVLVCAVTTFLASKISSFLKIFVSIFSTETIVFGIRRAGSSRAGRWPEGFAQYLPPESLPLTVAIFSILVYAVAQIRALWSRSRGSPTAILMPAKQLAPASGLFPPTQRRSGASP